jgi:sterol desaturase/sphingolipid hydroxylase (fatty acid hydroxylase superfamily)
MWPRRRPGDHLRLRWFSNFAVWALNLGLVRSVFPLLGVGVALLAAERGVGFLNVVRVPPVLGSVVAVLVLDIAKYVEHLGFHRVALLWRIHRMHHTDVEFDVSLGFRFHPLEAVLSTGWTLAVIGLMGLPAPAVAAWHVALLANATFAHGNVRMPHVLDHILRLIVVTPDMHRVHHSVVSQESGSNLGSLFPWWDRLLGTYVAAPAGGLDAMRIGVEEYSDRKHLALHWMLAHPFLRTILPPRSCAPRNREALEAVQPQCDSTPSSESTTIRPSASSWP